MEAKATSKVLNMLQLRQKQDIEKGISNETDFMSTHGMMKERLM
jgi:hypothetical protein